MKNTILPILITVVICWAPGFVCAEPSTCTYKTYKWNVKHKQAVERKSVRHSYASLIKDEVDTITGCSVCEEDQVPINLPSIKPFAVCKLLAAEIQQALYELIQQGEVIYEVIGYRVGMTKGPTDFAHNRTRFSNHSYGIALDINPRQNGLYDRCIEFGSGCRLIRGGHWQPGVQGSLTRESSIVRRLNNLGLRWGGQIVGKQKDFMHFSPTGY